MVVTSCDLNAPRCTTKVPQVRLHRSLGGAFIDHRPPRTPVIPCSNNIYIYIMSRQRSFTSVQTFHTHTHTHTSTLATLTVLTRFYKTSKVSDASTEALQEQGHAARTRLVRCFGVLHIQSIHRKSSYIRTETLWSYPTCCRETSPKKTSC